MSSSKARNFRRRAGREEDVDEDGGGGAVSTSTSSTSSSKQKQGPGRSKLLSFAEEENAGVPKKAAAKKAPASLLSFGEDFSQATPKKRGGFGTGHGSGHKVGAARDKPAAVSNVCPQAGEYTAERLQELQRNTLTLGRKPPPPAPADPAPQEPLVVLKGTFKPPAVEADMRQQEQVETVTLEEVAAIGLAEDTNDLSEVMGIPDAARIAAAKAQRERRRKAQSVPDYIPLQSNTGAELRSNLPEDKKNDSSSDDEEEVRGRLAFIGRANGAKEEAGVFPFANAVEQRMSPKDEEDEDEEAKWEEAQLRKGAGLRVDDTAMRSGHGFLLTSGQPKLSAPSRPYDMLTVAQQAESIMISLQDGLKRQQENHGRTKTELSLTEQRITASEENIVNLQKNLSTISEKFIYMQKLRDYVADLCEFLQVKGPLIEELEDRMQELREERAGAIFRRREGENSDEMGDIHAGVGAAVAALSKGGSVQTAAAQASSAIAAAASAKELQPELDEFGRDINLQKQRERKLRAAARNREAARASGFRPSGKVEAESTSEESDSDENGYRSGRTEVLETASRIFNDALEQYAELKLVKDRLEDWKRQYSGAYKDAYMSISAPAIFAPYVRLELLTWDPLYSSEGLSSMKWYPLLFNYGGDGSNSPDREDPDYFLIPSLVEKVALPSLHQQLARCWDRWSTRRTQHAVAAVKELLDYVPVTSKAVQELLTLVKLRLVEAVSETEVPTWSMEVTAAVPQAARLAAYRFGAALRLLRSIGEWRDVLAQGALEHLAFETLLNAKIVPHLRTLLPSLEEAVTRTERVMAALSGGFGVKRSRLKLASFAQFMTSLREAVQRSPDADAGLHPRVNKMLLELDG